MSNLTEEEKKYLIKLGNQIREVRNSKAWTQKKLGGEIEKERAYISKIERGLQNVTFLTLVKLADVLDCDVTTFTKNIPDIE
ncbi:MAG: helix-turn-helix domain-containing protein [Tannerellaceae bacterium]|nr:helix-turn-helix domain-containing protein [Tannerellaceae bacterium]